MTHNPFPGPQPFRASERAHFHGREDLSHRLEGSILAHRAVVVHGPSGSGKSSLIQASVLPNLSDSEDVRLVFLDGWPPGEDPTHWLALAMFAALKQGAPPADVTAPEAVLSSLKRAVRGSSRLLVICIDQLEQLFYPDRDPQKTEAFFDCVNDILDLPLRTLRVVMSLREDYLGVFRDRLRDHRRVLGQGFRVGPLSVAELTAAMCQTAASGLPPQTWVYDEMRALMMQVRVPGQAESDDAEAQAAYGQIVCRALFQERASGQKNTNQVVEALPILQRYLETTLESLGPLREPANRLLEDHLVSGDGGRTLRTEKELGRHFAAADLQTILTALEGAAILHAASHQGTRYFEIGHDWLARKVFEKRQIREQQEEQLRRDAEQARVLAKARRDRQVFLYIAVGALAAVVGVVALSFYILNQKRQAEKAKQDADHAALVARRREIDARDASILAGARELSSRGKLTWAMKLLPEVQLPAIRRGWVSLASDLLAGNALLSTLEGHTASLTTASFSPDGTRILTSSVDGTARIWDPTGKTAPIVLSGHTDSLISAAWSHDGKYVLTASLDGTARVHEPGSHKEAVVLSGANGPLTYAEFSPDDQRVVTAGRDGVVRIHSWTTKTAPIELQASDRPVLCARFHPDGARVFLGTQEKTVEVWDAKPKSKPTLIGRHDASIVFLALSATGDRLVSTSVDGQAIVWNLRDKKPTIKATTWHDGPVHHAAFSPNGSFLATASSDRMARIIDIDAPEVPAIVLPGHTQGVTQVAFDPTGYYLATASNDGTARIFRIQGGVSLVLRGHDAAVHSIAWSRDGAKVVTAAGDGTDRSPDETAKIWSTLAAAHLGLGSRGPKVFHSAFATAAPPHLATVHGDGTVRIVTRERVEEPILLPNIPGVWVAHASLSADGRLAATASFDKQIRLYHLDKPNEPVTLGSHEAEARFALFSADGTRVLSGGDDGRAFIFAVDGKNPAVKLEGHRDWLTSGAWSADGKRVVTGSFDHTARIWNADGQGAPTELVGHDAEVLAVAFFPDNNRVVTASADYTARIWTPGKEPQILQHDAAVQNLTVSPDNKFVVTYAADHIIRIWRVAFPDPPIEIDAATAVSFLSFDAQGQQLGVLDEEGSLHGWTVDVESLRERIIVANAECLPPAIRVLYLNENARLAEARYADCKRDPYSMPWIEPVKPELLEAGAKDVEKALGTRIDPVARAQEKNGAMVRVKIVVLPTDAAVEIDGVLTARRQGVVEFTAKLGQTRTIHVQRGAKHRSFDVKISKEGASPARLDLNDGPTETPRPKPKDKPNVTDHNPTLVNEMQ